MHFSLPFPPQVIPAGQTVLLDVSPPRLLMLLIQGSLVFDRKDLQLEATYILVQGGTLQIGTGRSLPSLVAVDMCVACVCGGGEVAGRRIWVP